MSSNPSISVIMPVYNTDEKYLRYSIESVLNQSLADFELIIINDGSTNNSEDVILSYQDKRIKYLTQNNSGQSKARNEGLKIAKGKYIFFLDSDDWIELNALDLLFTRAEEQNTDIILFKTTTYDAKTNIYGDWMNDLNRFPRDACFSGNSSEIIDNIFYINNACCGKLFRRSFLTDHNLFFVEDLVFEDTEFFFRYILKAQRIGILKYKLYFYRINVENSTTTKADEKQFDIIKVLDLVESTLKEYNLFNELKVKFHDYKIDLFNARYNKFNNVLKEKFDTLAKENLDKTTLTKEEVSQLKDYNCFLNYLMEIIV